MPPNPPKPLPPPPGIAGAGSFGSSATIASVVTRRPATEAASCSAVRTTLVGSMMPLATMSTYSSFWASKPNVSLLFSSTLPTTMEPSTPAFSAICRIGASSAFSTMLMPAWTSALSLVRRPTAFLARSSAVPPPGTMPSCTAARVALSASSTRSFFSLTSISVAPPTRITATPPASLASRSCSFSRS